MARDEHWHDRLWRLLQTPLGRGVVALGTLFGPVHLNVSDSLWAKVPRAGSLALPHHPERIRPDIPLSRFEAELARELGRDRAARTEQEGTDLGWRNGRCP